MLTDNGFYEICVDSFRPISSGAVRFRRKKKTLPTCFRDKEVVGVRSDGERIVIKLDNDGFIDFGYTINTMTGETMHQVEFFEEDEVDSDYLEGFEAMEVCVNE